MDGCVWVNGIDRDIQNGNKLLLYMSKTTGKQTVLKVHYLLVKGTCYSSVV